MQQRQVALNLHTISGAERLRAAVAAGLRSGSSMVADVGLLDDSACHVLGGRHVGAQEKPARGIVSRTTYCTVPLLNEESVARVADAARLTSELRVRGYQKLPDDSVLYGWEPAEFWDIARERPEERDAVFVLRVRDDGTAIDLRVPDDLAVDLHST